MSWKRCARLAVDLLDRGLERFERVGQILELTIEIFLALGLFLELVDRRQIHLAQAIDLLRQVRQTSAPRDDVRLGRHLLVHDGEIELRRLELRSASVSCRTSSSCAAMRTSSRRDARFFD